MPGLLVACFVLSGATSLVLQVVWVRQLIDVFGSSSLAISTVLATFMGGLALGAWVGGTIADRLSRRWCGGGWANDPLLGYAVCEALIAACALLIPAVVGNYRGANAWLWGHLGDSPGLLALARFGLASVALLPPTICMGATLPLLTRRITQNRDDLGALGRRIGALYAANTTGAVCGAAAAGFWMIPLLGVRTTNTAAATTAGILALGIAATVALRRRRGPTTAGDDISPPMAGRRDEALRLAPLDRRLAVIGFAISGAVAMALEVLWSRALAIVIGSSVYSFTLVLVVFLIGIAAGAALFARTASRTRDPLGLLAYAFTGVALAILLTHQLADDLPAIFLALLEGTSLDGGTLLTVHTLLTGLLILPTALCLGGVMPLVVRAYAGELEAVGRDVGRAYAFNTLGAITGAFAGGFIMLPLVGLETSVRAAAVAEAGLAALMAWRALSSRRRLLQGVAAGVLLVALVAPSWNRARLTAGVFRVHVAKHYIEAGHIIENDVVFYADGIATTVTVEDRLGRPVLKNNGKIEASTKYDMPTQVLVGLLPVLLHRGTNQEVFVVGYGSGITIGAIAAAPEVSRLDVVELEPEVYVAADRYFGPYNNQVADNPKVHRYVGDGRNFLLAGDRTYDVIVSEPSNPWIAGVASLFTREFYEFAQAHLSAGGVFCQWAQLYELGPRNVKMIYRTFHEAFPHVYAFTPAAHSGDTILIGSLQPLQLDLDHLYQRAAVPSIAEQLDRAQVRRTEDLLANLIMAPSEIPAFTAGAAINTDDNALLEYSAPRDLLTALARRGAQRLAATIYADGWPYGSLDGLVTGLGSGAESHRRMLRLALSLLEHGRRREAAAWVARARSAGADPTRVEELSLLIGLARPRTFEEPELPVASTEAPLPPPAAVLFDAQTTAKRQEATDLLFAAYGQIIAGQWPQAWEFMKQLPPRAQTDDGRDISLLMGYIAYKSVEFQQAHQLLQPLVDDRDFTLRRPAALYYAARVQWGSGNFREGVALFSRFIEQLPAAAREQANDGS